MRNLFRPVLAVVLVVVVFLIVTALCGVDGAPYAPYILLTGAMAVVVRQNWTSIPPFRLGTVENGALIFEPVWISSTEHLTRFDDAWQSTSWLGRLLGETEIADDMPQLTSTLFSNARVPVVLSAAGRLELARGTLHFHATAGALAKPAQWEVRGLDESLRFDLSLATVSKVEIVRHRARPSLMSELDWIHLVGEAPEGHFDILLSMGGIGLRAKSFRKQTRELLAALERERSRA